MTIHDAASLRRALRTLHDTYHVPHVVVSSIPLSFWLRALLPPALRPADAADGGSTTHLACIASSGAAGGRAPTVHATCFPCLPGYFSGVGDLFSALVLAHFHPSATSPPSVAPAQTGPSAAADADVDSTPLSRAASAALTKTHALLALTHAAAAALPPGERAETDEERDAAEPLRKVRRMRGRELRLVQGQDVIRGTAPGVCARRLGAWAGFWEGEA